MTSESVSPFPVSRAGGTEPEARSLGASHLLSVLFVCALAFLLASTPARNSDLWLHLASGRSLLQGQTPLGTDPFASTTAGVFWVNHTWLSDIIFCEIYKLGDGWALEFSKCVLVTALAGLLFCFRRRGTRAGLLPVATAGKIGRAHV